MQHLTYQNLRGLAKLGQGIKEPCKQIKAIESSSQDYNQSIFMTLSRDSDTFWSSTGSTNS
jgi:hypothetical protein